MFILTFIIASMIAFVIKNVFCIVDTFFNYKKDLYTIYSVVIRIVVAIAEIIAVYALLRIMAILKIHDLIEGFWMV